MTGNTAIQEEVMTTPSPSPQKMAGEKHGCKVRNPNLDDIERRWRKRQIEMPQPGESTSQLHQGLVTAQPLQTEKREKFALQSSFGCQQKSPTSYALLVHDCPPEKSPTRDAAGEEL